MLFERQEFQEQCISNVMQVLESSDNLRDFSALQAEIQNLHRTQSIPIQTRKNESRLDILMETGTGKTFTYLKCMYEMYKRFDQCKFIVFVPRLAIRAGIVQNINLTSDYFFQEYECHLNYYTYEGNLGQVESFINYPAEFSVLILTSNSVASTKEADRILTRPQESERFSQKSPIEALGKLRPVVFIDEPHLLTGEKFTKVYRQYFSQLLLLRFGATFPEDNTKGIQNNGLSNLVYMLDSVHAFQSNLVKRIRVSTIEDGENSIQFYKSNKSTPEKKGEALRIHYFNEGIEETADLRYKQNIASITGNSDHNFSILRVRGNTVYLDNGLTRWLDTIDYTLSDLTICSMIRQTIRLHFEKEERNFTKGIKTISLFFIPNIADFKNDKLQNTPPRIKKIFEDVYVEERREVLSRTSNAEYRAYLQKDYVDNELKVHNGYFSGDTKGSTNEIREYNAVDLILNDKTRLLSLNTPLRFVFSVWALQEGWDNPNIFTICKLASTNKETKRRQQVGRGLRIAIDQNGKRFTQEHCRSILCNFEDINELDIVVSAQERGFIEGIQNEIIGSSFTSNVLNRDVLNHIVKSNSSQFWNKQSEQLGIHSGKSKKFGVLQKFILQKAEMEYPPIHEETIIKSIQRQFNQEIISPVGIKVYKKTYNHHSNEIISEPEEILGNGEFFKQGNFAQCINSFAKRENLPHTFCVQLFSGINRQKFISNPVYSQSILSTITQETIHRSI